MKNQVRSVIFLASEGTVKDALENNISALAIRPETILRPDLSSLILIYERPEQAFEAVAYIRKITEDSQLRILLDSFELNIDDPSLKSPQVIRGWLILEHSSSRVLITESTRLILENFPDGIDNRKEQLRLSSGEQVDAFAIKEGKNSSLWIDSLTENSHLVRRQYPAPHDKRALAAVIDYAVAVLLLILAACVYYGPEVVSVIADRKRIEAEATDLYNAKVVPRWRASGGKTAIAGKKGSLTHRFPFPDGVYSIAFSYQAAIDAIKDVRIHVGEKIFSARTYPVREYLELHTLFENIPIKNQDIIVIEHPDHKEGVDIDYIEYFLATDNRYERKDSDLSTRLEDSLRFFGIWYHSNRSDLLWYLLVVAPFLSLFIQTLFLTFFRWTIGCRLVSIRIYGPGRKAPGLKAATFRALGHIASVPCFFLGWLWPLLNHGEQNWADIASRTRVTNRVRPEDEK